MSEMEQYEVKVTFPAVMPESWLRAHLDDMFADDVHFQVEQSRRFDAEYAAWECAGCGSTTSGAGPAEDIECPSCGDKWNFVGFTE